MTVHIEEDERFDRGLNAVQRAAWLVMLGVIIAALLGAFGGGVLAEATARADGPPALTVRYDRLARYQSPTEMVVEVGPAGAAGELQVAVSRGYLADVRLTGVTPEPERVTLEDDLYVYRFQVEDWSEPVRVHFELEPDHWGRLTGRIRARSGDAASGWAEVRQFVYP